jgi:uncharacterized protein YfiM (DUF2279 family)
MKAHLTVIIILLAMVSSLAAADQKEQQAIPVVPSKDSWFGPDKTHHFFTSAVMTGLGFVIINTATDRSVNSSLAISGTVTFSIGALKEIRDKHNKSGHASLKDMLANVLGIGLGILLMKTV